MKHLTEEQIAQYAEALSEGNLQKIDLPLKEHVKECNQCADEIASVSAILDEELTPSQVNTKVRTLNKQVSFWVSIAAGLVILIGVGAYFLYFQNNEQLNTPLVAENQQKPEADTEKQETFNEEKAIEQKEKEEQDTPEVTEPQPEGQIKKSIAKENSDPSNQLAESYRPSSRLEQLSARYDGVSMRSDGFEMRSNHILSASQNDTLKISWIADQDQELLFSLYDNKETLITEKAVPVKGYSVLADYDKGLYYYKVVNQDFDLLYCGKIIIE